MTTLSKAKNGDWFARKAIPPDVRDAYQLAYGVRQEVRFRLAGTVPQNLAKAEFGAWVSEVESRIGLMRSAQSGDSVQLTHRQVHVVVGRWYDWFVAQHDALPLPLEVWDSLFEQYQSALESFGGLTAHDDDSESPQWHRTLVLAKVTEISRLPSFLAQEALLLDSVSHAALLDALQPHLVAAMSFMRRQAGGDFSPDSHRTTLPNAGPVAPSNVKLAGMNAWGAFEAWVAERKPAAATVNRWRGVLEHLNKHLDGRDVALVTDEDAVAWKDKLVTGAASGRTINEVWLTAARGVFNWVKTQKKISSNPFDGIKVAVAKSGPTKTEFTDDDAKAILTATLVPLSARTSPYFAAAVRWVPWLCAYTGARAGEMTQLRREDVEKHRDGFWTLRISPEAGTVKGAVTRTVVLHDHLVEQGFVDFVTRAGRGPLFYDPKAGGSRSTSKTDDPLNPVRPMYVLLRQKLAEWVRNLGVTDKGVSPNHAWRHTFKRRAARAKIEQRIRDAFCGHSAGHVGAIYELPTVEDLAEAIKDLPRYPVDTP
ncbi:hypothetical protein [Devosia sp. 2618]|uniref:hypothetical protein n=1 Tax=Devosia sp. 2618 TaxID=3156454 RepID=UPI00339610F9